jgi:uncharacterized membrane protein YqjE
LLASLRSLAASAIAILRTRLDLLATEVEEARVRVARLVFWGVLALVFLSVGLMMFTLLVVVLFWDTYRVTVVALLAVGYFALGLGIVLWVRANLRSGPKLFAASLSEFAKDQEQLTSRDVP